MSGTHKQDIDSIGIWGGGVTSGLIAGIAMGLVLHLGGNQIELLGGLATEPSTAIGVGWTIHLMISVVFGLLFAAVASRSFVRQQIGSFGDYIIMGLVFGAVIGLSSPAASCFHWRWNGPASRHCRCRSSPFREPQENSSARSCSASAISSTGWSLESSSRRSTGLRPAAFASASRGNPSAR